MGIYILDSNKKVIIVMTSNDESTSDPTDSNKTKIFNLNLIFFDNLASSTPFHFGQLVWAKLGSAPFWPAVIFTEENQDWIRQKGNKDKITNHKSLSL